MTFEDAIRSNSSAALQTAIFENMADWYAAFLKKVQLDTGVGVDQITVGQFRASLRKKASKLRPAKAEGFTTGSWLLPCGEKISIVSEWLDEALDVLALQEIQKRFWGGANGQEARQYLPLHRTRVQAPSTKGYLSVEDYFATTKAVYDPLKGLTITTFRRRLRRSVCKGKLAVVQMQQDMLFLQRQLPLYGGILLTRLQVVLADVAMVLAEVNWTLSVLTMKTPAEQLAAERKAARAAKLKTTKRWKKLDRREERREEREEALAGKPKGVPPKKKAVRKPKKAEKLAAEAEKVTEQMPKKEPPTLEEVLNSVWFQILMTHRSRRRKEEAFKAANDGRNYEGPKARNEQQTLKGARRRLKRVMRKLPDQDYVRLHKTLQAA